MTLSDVLIGTRLWNIGPNIQYKSVGDGLGMTRRFYDFTREMDLISREDVFNVEQCVYIADEPKNFKKNPEFYSIFQAVCNRDGTRLTGKTASIHKMQIFAISNSRC
ncbi:hypothetical protein EYC80_007244 [Monilinia laxa]|uniref:Uncharacterized protein n=1 Tax=Monilinia laxa TaxID=61186 RepID=A0A5N6K0Q7_MONLA|nr:hypothetical protein EYC80_007244 [Monilinia laxa]